MQGRMQDWPLTVDRILDHAKSWHGDREIVSRSVEGPIVRTTYAQVHDRAKRVSNVLKNLGVQKGDRVATLAWNSGRHMEIWYGIMGMGAVCHTLNPRLFAEQLVYIINHAEDRVIFTDLTFTPILASIRDQIPTVKQIIVLTDSSHMNDDLPGALCYETLLDEADANFTWGGFDENSPAGLCYTSGTTGNPKGVLYSHRSNFLHTLVTMGADVLNVGARDVILPVVPMFHANAWGLSLSAPAAGAKLVMPGPKMDGASIFELLETEKVTFSAAVPTVWQMLLNYLRENNLKPSTLKRVVIGGSAVPEAIVRAFRDDYGVDVTHAWGMTETSPLGTQATPNHKIAELDDEAQLRFKLKQGRPPLGIDLRLTDDDGKDLPRDGHTFGKLLVKGPFVVGEYFRGDGGAILDDQGFFDTGDVATLDEHGFMQITDRSKDVIKSGGEWISSIEIENIAAGHPKAELAAVIGVAHPKWDERPLLLVKLKPGETSSKEEFLQFLEGKIAKWWTPDDVVFVDDIPLGATGKIDKKLIRQRMVDYVLPTAAAAATATVALAAPPAPKIYAPDPMPIPTEPLAWAGSGLPSAAALAEPTPVVAEEVDPVLEAVAAPEPIEAVAEPEPELEPVVAEVEEDFPLAAHAEPERVAEAEPLAEPVAEAVAEAAPEAPRAETVDDVLSTLPREEGWTVSDAPLAMPLTPRRAKAKPQGDLVGRFLIFTAAAVAASIVIALVGVAGVLSDLLPQPVGVHLMAMTWAPQIALLSLVLGVVGLLLALFTGAHRAKAALLVAASVVTLGVFTVLHTPSPSPTPSVSPTP